MGSYEALSLFLAHLMKAIVQSARKIKTINAAIDQTISENSGGYYNRDED